MWVGMHILSKRGREEENLDYLLTSASGIALRGRLGLRGRVLLGHGLASVHLDVVVLHDWTVALGLALAQLMPSVTLVVFGVLLVLVLQTRDLSLHPLGVSPADVVGVLLLFRGRHDGDRGAGAGLDHNEEG